MVRMTRQPVRPASVLSFLFVALLLPTLLEAQFSEDALTSLLSGDYFAHFSGTTLAIDNRELG
jgi:hypothetical protein